jgi:hypothetical protein
MKQLFGGPGLFVNSGPENQSANQMEMHGSRYRYKIDDTCVAIKGRCVARIGWIA